LLYSGMAWSMEVKSYIIKYLIKIRRKKMKEEITVYKDGTNYYVAEDSALVRIARLDNCYSDNRVYDNSYFLMENEGEYYVYSVGTNGDFEKIENPKSIYNDFDEEFLTEVFFNNYSEDAILYWDGSN